MAGSRTKSGSKLRAVGIAVGGALVLVSVSVGFLGLTKAGTAIVLRAASPFLSSKDMTIEIADAGPLLSGYLRVGKITVADAKGVYAEVDNLSVDWSPSALLGLTFKASDVRASNVRFDRLPVSSSSSSSQSSSSLPVAVDIANIALPKIELGSSFSGKAETLSLGGAAAVNNANAAVTLAVQDLGNSAAKGNFSLNYDIAAGSLSLDGAASEPKNGIIAGILDLPGRPALGFNVKGNGPLENWTGSAAASVEGLPVVNLDMVLKRSQSGLFDVALQGGGALDAILPPSVEPLFKGRTDIDLAVGLDPEGAVTITRGLIKSEAVTAELGGTLSQKGNNDFQARVTPATTGGVAFGFTAGSREVKVNLGDLDIAVKGAAEQADISGSIKLLTVAVPEGVLSNAALSAHASAFNLVSRSGTLSTALTIGGSTLQDPSLQRLLQAPVKLTAPVKVSDTAISADFALQSGSIGGTGSVAYDLASSDIQSSFKLFAAPSALPPSLAAKLTKTVGLSGDVAVSSGDISASKLVLDSELVSAEGSAAMKNGVFYASFDGALPDLSRLQDKATGKGTFLLSAKGALDALAGKLELDIPEASLSGKVLDGFKLVAQAKLAGGGIDGDIQANGSIAKQAIDVSAVLKQVSGSTHIPDIKVLVGKNSITGAMVLNAAFEPDGKLAFDMPDLSLIGAMAGQPLKGALKGALTVQSPNGALAAKLDLASAMLSYGDVNISGVDAGLAYANSILTGDVKVAAVASGANRFEKAALLFNQNGTGTDFALTGNFEGQPVNAKGAVQTGDQTTVHIDTLSATVRKIPLKLVDPTDIAIVNGAANVKDLKIAAAKGIVSLSGRAGSTLDLQVKLDKLPASLADTFSPGLGAEGAISGTIRVSGQASNPAADFVLNWPGAGLAATRSMGLPALGIDASGKFANSALDLTASASGGGLSVKGGGKLTISGNKPIAMRFAGSAPLSLAQSLLTDQGIGVSGAANFDMSIGGSLSALSYRGKIDLASVGAALPRQNLNLTGIGGSVTLDGKTATISGVTGKFTGGGTFSLSGTVGIAPGSGYPGDIAVKLKNVSYSDGSLVTALLSGDLAIKGPLMGGSTLTGTVNVAKATITVPEKIPASLAAINLKHINPPANVALQAKELRGDSSHSEGSSSLNLALDVNAINQIFVRGRGMDAELGGSLKIAGTTANPIVSGGFKMIRGRLEILGKRLDFSSGTIGFGGGLVPSLNLVASSTVGSLSISIDVSGTANDPDFAFTSSPSRPQDEVLAQLVFGRSSSSLSPLQIAQLADAVAQLAGGRSTSIFSKLSNGVGIDDLDVTTDSSGNAQVTAGKYLNDKTYLELQQGSTSGSGKAIINLDAGKGIKLRGEADSSGAGAAGVFYEKEY